MSRIEWKETTALTNLVKRRVKWKGHESVFIYGRRGSGKSTYALLLAYSIYRDWNLVFKYCVFDRDSLLRVLAECYDFQNRKIIKRIPVLIWDDATVSTLSTKERDLFLEEFARFYTTIRSVVAFFVWTGPTILLMSAKLRSVEWTLVHIARVSDYKSHANFLKYMVFPNGRTTVSNFTLGDQKLFESFYFSWIPQDIRARYEVKRDGYSIDGYLELEKAGQYMKNKQVSNREIAKRLASRLATIVLEPEKNKPRAPQQKEYREIIKKELEKKQ